MLHRASSARTWATRAFASSLTWAAATTLAHAEGSVPEPSPQPPQVTQAAAAPDSAPPVFKLDPIAPVNASFQRGIEALSNGQPRDAIAAFELAYAEDHNPWSLRHIGIAQEKLEHPHGAVKAWRAYIEQADAQRDAETITQAKQDIERLRSQSGRIGLHMVPAHAKLTLDEELIEAPYDELLVAPGKHAISATADGYKPFSQALEVLPGQFTLEIQLERIDTSAAATALAAPQPATPPLAALKGPTDEPEQSKAEQCLLAQVCVGPVAALIGPPNLIGGGVHARIGRYLGVGVDYQVLPKVNFNPLAATTSLFSANARVYPFGGAFFVSAGIGYQAIKGEVREGDISVRAETGFPAAMASIGFMGHNGFVLGADLGLLFPLSPMRIRVRENIAALAQNGVPQADIDEARADAESRVNKVLSAVPVLVQLNLLRLGYMF